MTRKDAIVRLAQLLAAQNPRANPDYQVWMEDAACAVGVIETAMKDFAWHTDSETTNKQGRPVEDDFDYVTPPPKVVKTLYFTEWQPISTIAFCGAGEDYGSLREIARNALATPTYTK